MKFRDSVVGDNSEDVNYILRSANNNNAKSRIVRSVSDSKSQIQQQSPENYKVRLTKKKKKQQGKAEFGPLFS